MLFVLESVALHPEIRCSATAKGTQQRCCNPAALGMRVCRVQHSAALRELRNLEELSHARGLVEGPSWCGRKPQRLCADPPGRA